LGHYVTSQKVAGSIPDEVIGFQPQYDPGVDSVSNINEYQESSWAVKGGWHVRLTTSPPSMSHDFLENMKTSKSHKPMDLHGLLQG
jgi:hypothetical protein